jgi:TolA-binding protein
VIARGLNMIVGLGNPGGAASVFESEMAAGPDQPGTDALLLGLVNARLQQGKRKEAEAAVRDLERRFPASPYAVRARQNLDGAKK